MNPAGYVHSVRFHNAPTHIFRVELKSQTVSKVRQFSKVLDSLEELNSTSVFALMTQLYKEFLSPDDVTPLAIEGLILEILAEASRSLSPPDVGCPPWLRRAQEFLHSNFAKPFSLGDVATAAGVHPAYLAREFRRRYRTTPGEYTRRLRVEAAGRALSATDAPLSEIAASLGFSDQSHMGKHFKRLTGFTPAQYRANLKG
jgi:AraC family transcriptional regulator